MHIRPSADQRAPGIYAAQDSIAIPPLTAAETRVAGFVGLSEKGPMNEPTRVGTWLEFVELFGDNQRDYLAASVYGYFRNGGRACWVVRVAHLAPAGQAPTIEHAAAAEILHVDDWNKPSLTIAALNEGTWGNNIWVKVEHTVGAQALLTRDLDIGAGEALVSSTRGFEVGSVVRIHDRDHSDYIVITEVGDKLIRWATSTPVNRKHRAAAPTYVEVLEFELHVALRDRREVFKGLQMSPLSRHYAPRQIAARSRLIRLRDLGTSSPVPHNRPRPLALTRLAGGNDGAVALTPEDVVGVNLGPSERTGLLAFEPIEEVCQLVIPDAMRFYDREPGPAGELKAQRVQDEMVSMCERLHDRFAILDIPQSRDIEWVRRWRRRTDSSYCAFYWPWLVSDGQAGNARAIPPSGIMAGVFAARDNEGVHVAPANVDLVGVSDLSLRVSEDHLGVLNSDCVNGFRIQRGVRPWGARTASSEYQWRYIPVRRLFIMLQRTLNTGFGWVVFEPNNQKTWDFVRDRTTSFLSDLHRQGMLVGGNPEQAFFVKCDAEVNGSDEISRGILICEIGVAPVSPAEFITLSMSQQMAGPGGDAG